MALRAHGTLTPDKRAVAPGEGVTFAVKIENTGSAPEAVRFEAEATNVKPPFPLEAVEPPQEVPSRSRRVVSFTWLAKSPDPGAAKTVRGEARLAAVESGAVVARAPFDVYVAAPAPP